MSIISETLMILISTPIFQKLMKIFFHTLNLVNYILPGAKSGKITQDYLEEYDKENEHTSLYAVQYFYNNEGQKTQTQNFT